MKRKKMSRLLIAASLCLALIFTYSAGALAVQVLAADPTLPTVTLVASSSKAEFTFNRPKQTETEEGEGPAALMEETHDTMVDLFDNFKNVMPGDHLTQTIRVQAAASNDSVYKIYLYARVCGDNTEANLAFLDAMELKVSMEKTELDVLNAGENAQGIYLGTFAQGTGEDLTVDLQVPIEMGNEFQNAECYVNWYFYAEQVTGGGGGDKPSAPPTAPPATTSEPVPTAAPSPVPSEDIGEGDVVIDDGEVPAGELPDIELDEEGVPVGDMPQTGDDTNLPLLMAAMVASGSALGGILIFGRKRESDKTK